PLRVRVDRISVTGLDVIQAPPGLTGDGRFNRTVKAGHLLEQATSRASRVRSRRVPRRLALNQPRQGVPLGTGAPAELLGDGSHSGDHCRRTSSTAGSSGDCVQLVGCLALDLVRRYTCDTGVKLGHRVAGEPLGNVPDHPERVAERRPDDRSDVETSAARNETTTHHRQMRPVLELRVIGTHRRAAVAGRTVRSAGLDVHARERARHVPAGDGVTDSERRFQTRPETVPGTVAERGSRKQPSPDVRFTAECVGDDAHEARAVHTTRTGTAPYIRLTVELPCDPRTAGKSGAVRRSSVRDETASCVSGHTSVWPAGSLQRLGLSRVQSLEERPSPLGNRLADDELTAVDDALRLVCTAVACVTAGGETDLD